MSEGQVKSLPRLEAELELRSRARMLEDRERTAELEIARRLDQETRKVREETARTLTEEYPESPITIIGDEDGNEKS
jgi:hypothetical protein